MHNNMFSSRHMFSSKSMYNNICSSNMHNNSVCSNSKLHSICNNVCSSTCNSKPARSHSLIITRVLRVAVKGIVNIP